MTGEPERTSKPGPKVERTRGKVLAAALELLLEEGQDAVTPARVAERSGVGRATVYRHWPDRMQLILDSLVGTEIPPAPPPTDDIEADLVALVDRFRQGLTDLNFGPILALLIGRSDTDPESAAVLDELYLQGSREFIDRVRLGQAQGLLPADLDPVALMAELNGPLMFRHQVQRLPLTDEFMATLVGHVLSRYRLPTL